MCWPSTDIMPASWPAVSFRSRTCRAAAAGLGAVTIQFREFGVRINFTPTITPRGTIRLAVTPEVSSLDFANGLIFQGFTIPALSTRRMSTEIELEEGQTFAIGGLLDNRDTETFNKIPGLGDIPFFGNLFRSRQITKNNSELLVMVTPEIVRPIPKGQPRPELKMTRETFCLPILPRTPPQTAGHGCDRAGAVNQDAARADHAGRGFGQGHADHVGSSAGLRRRSRSCSLYPRYWRRNQVRRRRKRIVRLHHRRLPRRRRPARRHPGRKDLNVSDYSWTDCRKQRAVGRGQGSSRPAADPSSF